MKSYIKSIGTAVPTYRNEQLKIADFMAAAVDMDVEGKRQLSVLYRASGIGYRNSVIPDFGVENGAYTFFPNTKNLEPFPTVGERMKLYQKEALPLAITAVTRCFEKYNDYSASDITHVITVSCTGMYAPGLDIELVNYFSMNSSVQRTNINFMGCYAAFNGMKVADAICKSTSGAKVLMVCIELCTIHYQKSTSPDQLLSNAIFSDGAAAVLIDGDEPVFGKALSLENFHCDLEPEGKDEMAWKVSDFGFEMILSSYIPELIGGGIGNLTKRLLQKLSLEKENVDYYAIHPGGKKILDVIELVLTIPKEKNKYAHKVLREFGNMSSPTVLFVLKEIMEELDEQSDKKNILSFAFGPGLTLESMLLKVHNNKVRDLVESSHIKQPIEAH